MLNPIRKAIFNAPKDLLEGLLRVVSAPPKAAVQFWNRIPEQDQELFRQAGLSAARLAAKAIIAADKGGKVEF